MPRFRPKKPKKRRPPQRKRSTALAKSGARERRVRVLLRPEAMEIVAGHDGLARGLPEPVAVVAAYYCNAEGTALVSRALVPFAVEGKAPSWAQTIPRQQPAPSWFVAETSGTVVVVAVAIEEDSGKDIQRIYADSDLADELLIWPLDGGGAVPCALDRIAELSVAEAPIQVGLHTAGGAPSDTVRSDDYVGTAAVWLATPTDLRTRDFALPIRSRDGRNHWIVNLSVAIRN